MPARILRYADKVRSDLSMLEFCDREDREAEELRRNPLPHTMPLALEDEPDHGPGRCEGRNGE